MFRKTTEQKPLKNRLLKKNSHLSRSNLIVFALIFGVIGGYTIWRSFAAPAPPPTASGLGYEQLVKEGKIKPAGKILEVDLAYNADTSPILSVSNSQISNGYAPSPTSTGTGYVIELLDKSNRVVQSTRFGIPNKIHSDSHLFGGSGSQHAILLNKLNFTLTVAWDETATKFRLQSSSGTKLIEADLIKVPVIQNKADFQSLPGNRFPSTPKSSFIDKLFPKAYAWGTLPYTLDITFVADHYTSAQLNTFHADTQRLAAKLTTIEPFKSRFATGQIRFYSVDNTNDLGCKYGAPPLERQILCDQTKVTKRVNKSAAQYDKIYVIRNDPTKNAGTAYIDGLMAFGTNEPSADLTFVHEFGHLLGLLDEYYYPEDGAGLGPITNKVDRNCYAGPVPPTASSWGSLVPLPSYKAGCADHGNWYSSSQCSMMLALDCVYFNTVSMRILNQRLNGLTFPIGTVYSSPEDITEPSAPANLAATAVSGAQVNLTWSASTDNVGTTAYAIYRDGTYIAMTGATSYQSTGLSPNTSYSFVVTALDAAGNESLPASATATTSSGGGGDTTPPTTPTSLTATVVSSSQINLSWKASTDKVGVTAYKVYLGSTYLAITGATNYQSTGLNPSTKYTYYIYAFDAAGNSSNGATISATTKKGSGTDTTRPSAPPNLKATAVSSSQINLSWDASTDNKAVQGYKVFRDSTFITNVTATNYSSTGLSPATYYLFDVYAYDAADNRSAPASITVRTQQGGVDTTPPTAPTNLRTTSVSSSQINMTWDPSYDSGGVTSYKVFRNGYEQATTTAPSFGDTSLSGGTSYQYWVFAYDAAGNRSDPAEATFTTAPAGDTGRQATICRFPDGTWYESSNCSACQADGCIGPLTVCIYTNGTYKEGYC